MKVTSREKVFNVSEIVTLDNILNVGPEMRGLQRRFNIEYMGTKLPQYYTGPGSLDEIELRMIKYLENYRDDNEICKMITLDESIPQELKKSIINAIDQGYSIDWLDAIKLDYERFSNNVCSLLQKASYITDLSFDELILRADYHHKERDYYRFSNSLAELRTTVYLFENGFKKIQLLQSLRKQRNVDIVAIKDDKRFAIDVYHISSQNASPKYGNIEL